jgi:O-methyltransferase
MLVKYRTPLIVSGYSLIIKLKSKIIELFKFIGYEVKRTDEIPFIAEADEFDLETIRLARQISMQSPARLWALVNTTKYITLNNIPGAFVECGVYKGGSAIAIARTLSRYKDLDRKI